LPKTVSQILWPCSIVSANPQPMNRLRLDSFLRDSAAEGDEPLDSKRL
jgi:hypothetical protein